MASVSRFFQANYSAALLRSATLAIALIVLASPARAEVVKLVCQPESGDSFTLQVDYDRKTVYLKGNEYDKGPVEAKITEDSVLWNYNFEREKILSGRWVGYWGHYRLRGSLNRLSGEGEYGWTKYIDDNVSIEVLGRNSGLCRRATQKF